MDNTQPTTENGFPYTEKKMRMIGPIVGALVLISTIAIALYLLGQAQQENVPPVTAQQNIPVTGEKDQAVATLETQSTSDEPASIDADLKTTDLNGVSTYVNSI